MAAKILSLALCALPAFLAAPAGDDLTQAELEALSASIQADIAELREAEFLRPVRVFVTDVAGLKDYAKKRIGETYTPEDLAREDEVAHLLGFLAPEVDLMQTTFALLEEQVGGFYDPASESFYLMSDYGGDFARIIMAHELTHALDDQLYDIDGKLASRDGNSDATFAFSAVVEGSGTNCMSRWLLPRAIRGELDGEDLAGAQDMQTAALEAAPPYIWKPMIAVYLRGSSFLVRSASLMAGQIRAATNADVDQAFRHAPLSSEQVLHPEKYWDEARWDAPRPLTFDEQTLPAGWALSGQDTLGEVGLALLTWPLDDRGGLDAKDPKALLDVDFTHFATEGWGGDRYALLARGDARVLHVASVWDTPADADEFAAMLARFEDHLTQAVGAFAQGGRAGVRIGRPAPDSVTLTLWSGVEEREAADAVAALALAEGSRELQPTWKQP